MKKLLIMAVAACCLAACNKELGPEYKVAPVISGVTFSPQEVHAGENVHVSATVTSEYGFTGISILYSLNEDPETTEEPKDQVWFGSEKDKSKNYKATIEGQKAGTKVTFQILAVSLRTACIRSPRCTNIPCRRSPNRSRCPTPKRINLPHYNLIWN